MHAPRAWWLGLVMLLSCMAVRAAEPLIVGVLPVHPTRMLVTRYEPLRAYLQHRLGRPTQIQTAADFRQFHQRTLRGDFHLAITPAHLARLAQKDQGFIPLARFTPDHDFRLVTRKDGPVTDLTDLRGQNLAVIDPLAITVMAALEHLERQGLRAGRDFRVIPYRTHASVIQALLSDEAAAAVSTSQGLAQVPDPQRGQLEARGGGQGVPAFTFLARPNSTPQERKRYQRALLDFPGTMEGLDFFGQTGYQGLRPVRDADLAQTEPYLAQTRRLLGP